MHTKEYTQLPDGKTENQIDHFCISRKFRRSLEDVRAVRGADVGTDHHMVLGKFRLHLKRHRNFCGEKRKKFQVSVLQGNKKDEFVLELKNRFQALQDISEDTDIETQWRSVRDAIVTNCENVLGVKKQSNKEWISQKSIDFIKERKENKEDIYASRTRSQMEVAQKAYRDTAKKAKKSIKSDKEEFTNNLAKKAEVAAADGHMRTLYQTTKMLTGKFGRAEVPVEDKNGKVVFGEEEQKTRWMEHFLTDQHLQTLLLYFQQGMISQTWWIHLAGKR